jgi:hypothetical protein
MRTTIERIQAGSLLPPEHLRRLGLSAGRLVRVTVETVDDEPTITEMNALGKAFDHLSAEPDIYSDADLVERNEDFIR